MVSQSQVATEDTRASDLPCQTMFSRDSYTCYLDASGATPLLPHDGCSKKVLHCQSHGHVNQLVGRPLVRIFWALPDCPNGHHDC